MAKRFRLRLVSFIWSIVPVISFIPELIQRYRWIAPLKMHFSSNDTPPSSEAAARHQAHSALEYARIVGKLKTTPRTGWVRRGVAKWESVADHSWRVSALSLLLVGREDIDVDRCIPMALVHDVAECITGDIAPGDDISKQEKQHLEMEAVGCIAAVLRGASSSSAQFLLDCFHEYEIRESNESRAVKDLDLLEMIIQADEYERAFGIDLSEFFDTTLEARFQDSSTQQVAREVHAQRRERKALQPDEGIEDGVIDQEGPPSAGLSPGDAAFVAEFSKSSTLSKATIEEVVKSLRSWDTNTKRR